MALELSNLCSMRPASRDMILRRLAGDRTSTSIGTTRTVPSFGPRSGGHFEGARLPGWPPPGEGRDIKEEADKA
jgi:hypothetical protein